MSALDAEGLAKSYGGRRVVDSLSLALEPGSVLGLLGPNGAGKTTTLRMLYGLVTPEAGTIRYFGRDFTRERDALKRMIGVCTQDDTLDYDFNVRQNLEMYARYFEPRETDEAKRITELLDRFGLTEYGPGTPHALSGGYKKRLQIARSIVHRPKVLFLDEPTTGLDPRARVDVWELVDQLRSDGMAVVLTTHYMDEAERLSDALCVLSKGKAIARGTPREVLGTALGEHILVIEPREPRRAEVETWIRSRVKARVSVVLGEVRVAITREELGAFQDAFAGVRFVVRPPNLDDLFLDLSTDHDPEAPAAVKGVAS